MPTASSWSSRGARDSGRPTSSGLCSAGILAAQELTPGELARVDDWYRRTVVRTGDGQWGVAIGNEAVLSREPDGQAPITRPNGKAALVGLAADLSNYYAKNIKSFQSIG